MYNILNKLERKIIFTETKCTQLYQNIANNPLTICNNISQEFFNLHLYNDTKFLFYKIHVLKAS